MTLDLSRMAEFNCCIETFCLDWCQRYDNASSFHSIELYERGWKKPFWIIYINDNVLLDRHRSLEKRIVDGIREAVSARFVLTKLFKEFMIENNVCIRRTDGAKTQTTLFEFLGLRDKKVIYHAELSSEQIKAMGQHRLEQHFMASIFFAPAAGIAGHSVEQMQEMLAE